MGDAARVIDWNGTDLPPELADACTRLPPGRYRVEFVEVAEGDDGFELTPEQEAGIEAAIRSADAGQTVSFEEAMARMTAKLSALR